MNAHCSSTASLGSKQIWHNGAILFDTFPCNSCFCSSAKEFVQCHIFFSGLSGFWLLHSFFIIWQILLLSQADLDYSMGTDESRHYCVQGVASSHVTNGGASQSLSLPLGSPYERKPIVLGISGYMKRFNENYNDILRRTAHRQHAGKIRLRLVVDWLIGCVSLCVLL